MLALARKVNQSIIIGNDIEITLLEIKGDQVKIGINAPKSVPIYRKEIYEQLQEENKKAADLRKDKLLYLDEKGQAYWLTKNVNDASSENYKDRIYKDIFFLSQVPALSDESFAGNLTGVAIKYKLIGLEELAIMKQNSFEAAQKKLVKLVTEYINLRYNKNFDPEIVQQKYERNFIANEAEMITNARNLENIVSRDTQLQMLPANIVPDSRKELEKIQKEMMESEHLPCVDEI